MQNSIPKLRQAPIISKNQGFFAWKIENFDELQLPEFNIFLLKFCTRFVLSDVYKRVCGIFFILFRSVVINKSVKNECAETRSFLIFANNSRSKQNKKNPTYAFVDIGK